MKKIKINFSDFWGGFNKTDNYFYNLLSEDFYVEISDNPDYLIYSVFGNLHTKYNCVKIFYTGENIPGDMNYCDWALTFDYLEHPNHYRLPLYVLSGDEYYNLLDKKVDDDLFNRKFCAFAHNNGGAKKRNDFFYKLSEYKKVDSAGPAMNNTGYIIGDRKQEWIKGYKFTFAFENDAYRLENPGYTTEKILHAMVANSIPIYWGNPEVYKDFNTKSFVNYYDFKNEDEMIEYIVYLDNNKEEYMKVLSEPWLDKIPEANKKENIKAFLYKIFENR
jgi:alpha(1,3/1,4) fucosyltransferase